MKLSEAIRAGAKIRPKQARGALYRKLWPWGKGASCALGAAYEAGDSGSKLIKLDEPYISRSGVVVPAGTVIREMQNLPEWNPVYFADVHCPQCDKCDRV